MSSVVDHDVAVMSIFELQQEAKYTISRHASYEISSCLKKIKNILEQHTRSLNTTSEVHTSKCITNLNSQNILSEVLTSSKEYSQLEIRASFRLRIL